MGGKLLPLLGLSLLLGATPVRSEGWSVRTVNDLKAACEIETVESQALCMGYLQGAIARDSISRWIAKADGTEDRSFLCEMPSGVTLGQLRDIFLNEARSNPEKGHYKASGVALYAFKQAICLGVVGQS